MGYVQRESLLLCALSTLGLLTPTSIHKFQMFPPSKLMICIITATTSINVLAIQVLGILLHKY